MVLRLSCQPLLFSMEMRQKDGQKVLSITYGTKATQRLSKGRNLIHLTVYYLLKVPDLVK